MDQKCFGLIILALVGLAAAMAAGQAPLGDAVADLARDFVDLSPKTATLGLLAGLAGVLLFTGVRVRNPLAWCGGVLIGGLGLAQWLN